MFVGSLTRLALPQLTALGGEVYLSRIPALEALDLGGLVTARDIGIYTAPALTTVRLGSLTTVENLYIFDAPQLTALSLPALERAGAAGMPNDPAGILLANVGLLAVDWPVLREVSGDVSVYGPALQRVQLPRLTTARGLGARALRSRSLPRRSSRAGPTAPEHLRRRPGPVPRSRVAHLGEVPPG